MPAGAPGTGTPVAHGHGNTPCCRPRRRAAAGQTKTVGCRPGDSSVARGRAGTVTGDRRGPAPGRLRRRPQPGAAPGRRPPAERAAAPRTAPPGALPEPRCEPARRPRPHSRSRPAPHLRLRRTTRVSRAPPAPQRPVPGAAAGRERRGVFKENVYLHVSASTKYYTWSVSTPNLLYYET